MLDLWNDSSLRPPPILTTLLTGNVGVKKLRHDINNIISILSRQSPLHKESALLSRFLYKFDKKFRNDIGYRNFRKVNTALHKYLALNLLSDVKSFSSVLPSPGEEQYLPTRQMLQYILIRLMTFSKIMFRICVCSKQAAIFYMDRLKRGDSYWMSLMPYGLLSRVWSVSLVLLQHATSWYSSLYTFLDKLDLKGIHLLPEGYELPNDLQTWLDVVNIDSYGKFSWSGEKYKIDPLALEDDTDNILDYVKQLNEESVEYDGETLNQVLTDNDKDRTQALTKNLEESLQEVEEFPQNIDKGESISREYFKKFFNTDSKFNDKQNVHSSAKVTSKVTLQKFLKDEESFRNEGDNQSLTQHLSFMQWHVLRTSLEKLNESLANNRKIERKFQKIWQEKCLDYIH
ncbi:uncharacterized protein LOC128676561 [Plodia interpunctella]|uniref:uncharacterized protein LOC128676561 n=1 Tax=Plodia interpunctella TaxID=58824 RepID=UPI002367A30D|nr:uncharacterized protein LOC128676561 [Plodia interpunctella]